MKTAEEILKSRMKKVNATYIADLTTIDIVDAMEEYAREQVKLFAIPNVVKPKGTVCDHSETYYDDRAGTICKKCKCIIPE